MRKLNVQANESIKNYQFPDQINFTEIATDNQLQVHLQSENSISMDINQYLFQMKFGQHVEGKK